MKLALNGALTIGTLDGANVEIREQVGAENIFIFGLNADQVAERRSCGIDGSANIAGSPLLSSVIAAIDGGIYSPDERQRYAPITRALRYYDYYMVTADFQDYFDTQRRVDDLWRDKRKWMHASICNIAGMGWFSSDRAISEYAEEIWKIDHASAAECKLEIRA
jgi:starch phosphorylase